MLTTCLSWPKAIAHTDANLFADRDFGGSRERGGGVPVAIVRVLRSSSCLLALINGSSREPDAKLLHPELERRTLHSKTRRGSVRPCNDSIRLFQSTQNLIPLRLCQHLLKALMGSGFGLGDERN